MTALGTIRLVAQREVRERVASRAFQVSTAFTILIVIAFIALPSLIGGSGSVTWTIGTTGDVPSDLTGTVEAGAPEGSQVTAEEYADEATLRAAVSDGAVDIGVVGDSVVVEGPATSPTLSSLVVGHLTLTAVTDRAGELGLTPEDLESLSAAGPTVDRHQPAEGEEGRLVAAFIGTMLLFISIVSYGQWILIGVVEEKTSRVVEVILGTVPARHLLAGKILGIGLLGLAQLLVIVVIGYVGIGLTDQFDVPDMGPGIIAVVVGWFLLGFAFYAAGFAIAGSLVSRQEDAQNAAYPLTLVLLAAYFVGASALGTGGDNVAVRVMSVVPPFSPLTMPLRQAAGTASVWEVVVSIVLMLGAIVLMLRLGGRVYAGGLLRGGRKVKIRDAYRTAEV